MSGHFERDSRWGCDLWRGQLTSDGYGVDGGKLVHRLVWERAHGAIPDGMVIDHGCVQKNCGRLAHLEMVTQSENNKRRQWRYRSKRTHCKNGHDLKLQGIVLPTKGIVCRVCNREEA